MPIRYIQRKDGTLAGSIGSGRDEIPTPAHAAAASPERREPASQGSSVEQAWRAYGSRKDSVSTEAGIDMSLFRIDDSFPVPQANSLAKVAATVDAIEGGADTDEAVALAIGVTPRQGAYYANAAGYLGLVSPSPSASPRQWGLTPAGAQFLNANAETRANILGHVVATMPEVVSSLNDGAEVEELLAERLGETTALRRAATVESWVDVLTDAPKAKQSLTLETDGVRARIDDARAVATRAREEAQRRARIERPTNICSRCFMALPVTGACSNCDD